ncbi:Protein bfr2 [Sphaceloma murrayae]|uniref:Protein bfr2 n=1 Tax=Sphaceloma murrayae TaxID=2082308 RepID=A0A2K1QRQ7_9PEZI|nr:Protein bfr2 [Sphaceloma murrayae]
MAPLTLTSLSHIPTSFATCSLSPSTDLPLPDILHAISSASFTAIELSFPNLIHHASALHSRPVPADDYDALCLAASDIARLCASLSLEIILLQPFANFEGWAPGSPERDEAFARAKGWIRIMVACGCSTLQVGSTDTPVEKIDVARDAVVRDLRALADLLAEQGLRMAYENWCWSSHAPGWREVWEIVKEVDRGNVGLCLDTFQSAGGEWGDPTTGDGVLRGDREGVEARFRRSMEDLAREVPAEKIYLLQISDAYRMEKPLEDKVVDGLRPRGRWSHDYRPLPGTGEGYLPCKEVARAVLKTGFRGWWSYEVFDSPEWKVKEDEKNGGRDLVAFAKKARTAHEAFLKECADEA